MTGRECLLRILHREPTDRLAWTTLADDRTRSVMPEKARSMPVVEFYRHVGCDILQFGNFALPKGQRVVSPARLVQPEMRTEECAAADGTRTRRTITEWGTLTARFRNGHPVEHPVRSLDELRILRNIWEASHYEEVEGHEGSYARVDALIGDDGVFVPTVNPSPVQQLLEFDLGIEGFYALLQEHRREVEDLMETMHSRRCREYEILARRTPAPAVIPVENTSTSMISPALYARYSVPQIRDFCDMMHGHGKRAILHMCGMLKGILPHLRETRMDGINGLTPPPVGDTPLDLALDVLGEDLVIFGGLLDAAVFQAPAVTSRAIRQALEALYSRRIRRAHLVLWLAADGLATPLGRFLTVRDGMRTHGLLE